MTFSRVRAVRNVLMSIFFGGLLIAACGREDASDGPKYTTKPSVSETKKHYIFAVHPLYNPQLLHQKYFPLMQYLNSQIPGAQFDVDTSSDYASFENKLKNGIPDFALPNPYHAAAARDWGFHVIAKMSNDDNFRGVFIVRKDSSIKSPEDLRGKIVAYPAPTALAAAMMPQLYLQNHGVDVASQLDNRYVGTHDSSIMNAYLRQSDASATWPVAWGAFKQANPAIASELKVIWETPKLIQNAVIARNNVPEDVVKKVSEVLVALQQTEVGRHLLEQIDTVGFVHSNNAQFEVVAEFLKEYRAKVKKER